MENSSRKQGRLPGIDATPGLEEMNLVEFPLAVLADSAPKGKKTIEFADSVYDRANRAYVDRRCIVTGSDKWGLPVTPGSRTDGHQDARTQISVRLSCPATYASLR